MIIGLMGQAQSGKDTVADHMMERHKFIKVAFADALKELAMQLFELYPSQVYTFAGKQTLDPRFNKTPRQILQELGTALRNIDPEIWTDTLFRKMVLYPAPKKFIVSDVRLQNEVDMIHRCGGKVIRLIREDFDALEGSEAQHATEQDQLIIEPDFTISRKSGQTLELCQDAEEYILCQQMMHKTQQTNS